MNASLSRRSLVLGAGALALPADAAPKGLPRVRPEAEGVDPDAIRAFADAAGRKGLHSLMLLRRGNVFAEGWWDPYGPAHPHMLYSLSKSFTSTAVGLAREEGLLKLDDPVVGFFPESKPATVDANLAAMQVRHLLCMGTGHDQDSTGPVTQARGGDWPKAFLALPVPHAPGSKFVYNSGATYMLSAIVQKVTGKTVLEYLKPRLFGPLGIARPTWETCPQGRSVGGWGLSITTEDIARFGHLYLRKGKWGGRQIVPEAWVAEATSKQIVNGDPAAPSDWTQGYGYQFWRCRHGAYRGDGAFGQFCIVLPQFDAVVALTAGSGDLQGIVNAVWEHLLPAYGEAQATVPDGRFDLGPRSLAAPSGAAESPTAAAVRGKTFRFDGDMKALRLEASRLVLTTTRGEQSLPLGGSRWARGRAALAGYPSSKVAVRSVWTATDTLTLTVCYYETPYVHTLVSKFAGDTVTLTQTQNVAFGPSSNAPLTGRI